MMAMMTATGVVVGMVHVVDNIVALSGEEKMVH